MLFAFHKKKSFFNIYVSLHFQRKGKVMQRFTKRFVRKWPVLKVYIVKCTFASYSVLQLLLSKAIIFFKFKNPILSLHYLQKKIWCIKIVFFFKIVQECPDYCIVLGNTYREIRDNIAELLEENEHISLKVYLIKFFIISDNCLLLINVYF